MFAAALALSASSGVSAQSRGEVEDRDKLIADQENLLNTYRCMFGADVDLVPGTCPNPDIVAPGVVPKSLTRQDLAVRDRLIADQEALLNIYRCTYNIDTELVVKGCDNSPGPAAPQASQSGFVSVSAGSRSACGVKSDGNAFCWGYGVETPDTKYRGLLNGGFTEISMGNGFGCALSTDALIYCLGRGPSGTDLSDRYGPSSAYTWDGSGGVWYKGKFSSVSAGGQHHCALRVNQSVICFGSNYSGDTYNPPGKYSAVSAGAAFACAVHVDQAIVCWSIYRQLPSDFVGDEDGTGSLSGTSLPRKLNVLNSPSGRYTAVSASLDPHSCHEAPGHEGVRVVVCSDSASACALGVDQAITCWGDNPHGQTNAPSGRFIDISVGGLHACALGVDQAIACWGDNSHGQTDAPSGRFISVSAGIVQSCGVKLEGTIVCWGYSNDIGIRIVRDVPSGHFSTIATAPEAACAIRIDSTLACWGSRQNEFGFSPVDRLKQKFYDLVPSGEFRDISMDNEGYMPCAINGNGTAVCHETKWYGGWNKHEIPGEFTAVVNTIDVMCAVGIDQALSCLMLKPAHIPDYKWGDDVVVKNDKTEKVAIAKVLDTVHQNHLCLILTDGQLQCNLFGHYKTGGSYVGTLGDYWWYDYRDRGQWIGKKKILSMDLGLDSFINGTTAVLCIVREDHTLTCGVDNKGVILHGVEAVYIGVEVVDSNNVCGIKVDQTVTCWDLWSKAIKMQTTEKFSSLFAQNYSSSYYRLNPTYFCGIKTDGSITCWSWVTNLPDGVSYIY